MRFAIFVTGASRGLGRALAAAFASRLHADGAEGTFILLGRDDAGMKETATLLQAAMPGAVTIVQSMDLADLDTVESSWQAALRELQSSGQLVDAAILVNNSGSLGELKPVRELTSLASISSVVTLNVTSVIWLTSLFLRSLRAGSIVGRMGAPPPAHGSAATSHVVNVSSLCAIKAFSSQSLYCAGKAARDMLHAVVAEEEAVDGAAFPVKTLNYAPGPLDTDMQRELRESDTLDVGARDMFAKMKSEGTLIDPATSATKCAELLFGSTGYTSGAHIDFYDLP